MALQIFSTDAVGTGTPADLSTVHDVFVEAGVTVGSEDDIAVDGTGSGHFANIAGTVVAPGTVIRLGNTNHDSGQKLTVHETGFVTNSETGGDAILLYGSGSFVDNRGTISVAGSGIGIGGDAPAKPSQIDNTGVIEAVETAIFRNLGAVEDITVNNWGIIKGGDAAYNGDGGTDAQDFINNFGLIEGNIYLGSGDDVYDGTAGQMVGIVYGGTGNDEITGGSLGEKLYGGGDQDTVIGGVGNDTLAGEDGNDRLDGGSGNDTLIGGLLDDILIGGAGQDSMSGNNGNDTFVFSLKSHSRVGAKADLILEFDKYGNDRIDLSALRGPALKYIHDDAFTGAGQVRIKDVAGADVVVEVNLSGSLAADVQVRLTETKLASMSKSDFIL